MMVVVLKKKRPFLGPPHSTFCILKGISGPMREVISIKKIKK